MHNATNVHTHDNSCNSRTFLSRFVVVLGSGRLIGAVLTVYCQLKRTEGAIMNLFMFEEQADRTLEQHCVVQ